MSVAIEISCHCPSISTGEGDFGHIGASYGRQVPVHGPDIAYFSSGASWGLDLKNLIVEANGREKSAVAQSITRGTGRQPIRSRRNETSFSLARARNYGLLTSEDRFNTI